ncbi:MAG: hypothetical protein ABI841_00885 [Chloroflexota bacterium]
MALELRDLIADLAVHAVAAAGSALGCLFDLYSAGASNGLDPGPLVVGGGAGGVAGGAAVGSGSGTTGSGTGDGTTGGSNVGRDDATRPRVPTSVQARRDAGKGESYPMSLKISDVLQKWTESIVGEKLIEVTGPRSGGAAPHA